MKIAHLIPSLVDCGSNKIPFALVNGLCNKSVKSKVFFFNKKEDKKQLMFNAPTENISFQGFCSELNEYDIIHSHVLQPDLYLFKNYERLSPKKVTTLHGYHIEDLRYEKNLITSIVFGNLWDIACKKLDLSICITHSMEAYYKNKGFKKTITILNGVEMVKINQNIHNLNNNYINIGTVSNLNPRKGIDQLVKLLKLNNNYYLTAVGGNDKNINSLRNLATELGVEKRCNFIEHTPNPWDIISNCDVFIFPSRSEGFGLALVEAALLGIPIICSDIPTFREMFDENQVLFFELDNIEELNNRVLNLEKLKYKLMNAKSKAEEVFSIDKMCSSYYETYNSLLTQGKRI